MRVCAGGPGFGECHGKPHAESHTELDSAVLHAVRARLGLAGTLDVVRHYSTDPLGEAGRRYPHTDI